MSEIKRPRPITRVLPEPGTVEYTEGCTGCRTDCYYHNAQSKRRAPERAASASHVGGVASRVRGAISIQTTHAAGGAASSSHVGGVSNQIQSATHAGVQRKAGLTAVHVEAANHGVADVAVVEHPHPHEDEEHVEWEHPDKGYLTERRTRCW